MSKQDEHLWRKLVQKPHFDDFNTMLERKQRGEYCFWTFLNKPFEPEQVIQTKDDIVTTDGLQHQAALGVGESALIWGYGASGTGTNPESSSNQELQTELARIVLDAGSRFRSGTSMKFGMYFDSPTPSGTVTEWAPANGATPGVGNSKILCRTVQTPGLPHVQNQTFFLLTQVVDQVAIA